MKLNIVFVHLSMTKNVIDKLDLINPDPKTNYEILEKELKESHQECFPVRTVKFNGKKHKKNHG